VCEDITAEGKQVLGGGAFSDKMSTFEYGDKVTRALLKDVKPNSSNTEGIRVSTEGWFNGKEWVRPFNHSVKQKRLMNGDIGPVVDCMGVTVWPSQSDKLTTLVLEPLAPLLEKVGYTGPVSANCSVDEESVYHGGWKAGLDYDALQAWIEMLQPSLFDYLYNIATQAKSEVSLKEGEQAIAVRLSVAPYCEDLKVVEVPKEASGHVWLADVTKKDDEEVLAGVSGVVGCITARGATVRECQRRAYRTINNVVKSKEVQYRRDIGDGVEDIRGKLLEWGWL
jgi:phosphoribosylamine--glycine ligase